MAQYLLERRHPVYFATESELIAKNLVSVLKKRSPGTAKLVKVVPKPKLVEVTDLILVFGGDGTYLSIARLMKSKSVPVMGINMGQLGFLTEIKRDEALAILENLLAGHKPLISERSL